MPSSRARPLLSPCVPGCPLEANDFFFSFHDHCSFLIISPSSRLCDHRRCFVGVGSSFSPRARRRLICGGCADGMGTGGSSGRNEWTPIVAGTQLADLEKLVLRVSKSEDLLDKIYFLATRRRRAAVLFLQVSPETISFFGSPRADGLLVAHVSWSPSLFFSFFFCLAAA